MLRKNLAISLMIMGCAVPAAFAQTAATAGTTQVAANVVDAASVQALKKMGAYLQTLQRFQVKDWHSSEVVLDDGQKLQKHAMADVQVQRPNKLRALMVTAMNTNELIYDGKTTTIYTPELRYYANAESADTIGGTIKQLDEKYGIEVPLTDLFLWGTDAAPVGKIESAMNAGQEFIGKQLCDHYAFRQGKFDWQIWIAVGEKPLPHKIVITNRNDEARPQSETLLNWNLNPAFTATTFKFTPPKDAKAIAIRPLNTK
jgi:hypothetical protein